MNKKKFLATCTLVAFGSTMLPAFAFAATPGTILPSHNEKIEMSTLTTSDKWLDTKDTVTVEKVTNTGLEDVTDQFASAITAFTSPGSTDTAGKVEITPKSGTKFVAGEKYRITVANTNRVDSAPVVAGDVSDKATDTFSVVDVVADNAASILSVKDGKIVGDQAKLGMVKVTLTNGAAASDALYPLSEKNALIAKGATAVEGISLASGASQEFVAANLTANTYYGVATPADVVAGAVVPTAIVYYSADEAQKIADVNNALEADVTNRLAIVPTAITIDTADGKGNILDEIATQTNKVQAGTLAATGTSNIALVKVSGALEDYVDAVSAFDPATKTFTCGNAAGDIDTLGVGPVNGNVTIAVQIGNVYKAKTVAVTVNVAPSYAAVKKAYATENGMTNYAAGTPAATADLTLAAVGEGLALSEYSVVDGGSAINGKVALDATTITDFAFHEAFDAKTGKVIALPEKDLTVTLPVKFGATELINVTLTIKAAEEVNIEELEQAYKEAQAATMTKINELTAVEGKLSVAQLNDLYTAYKEYKAAKEALAAAKQ